MGKFMEYEQFDGLGLGELVRKKEVTPLELCEAAIERIEAPGRWNRPAVAGSAGGHRAGRTVAGDG